MPVDYYLVSSLSDGLSVFQSCHNTEGTKVRSSWVYVVGSMVRVFRQKFALEDAIGSHACSLEASRRVTNGIPLGCPLFLTGLYCKFRPNTKRPCTQQRTKTTRPHSWCKIRSWTRTRIRAPRGTITPACLTMGHTQFCRWCQTAGALALGSQTT